MPLDTQYADYLRDESRRQGQADSISFPLTESDLCRDLKRASSAHQTVTIQGARTGITAGAVPDGGHVLNLSRMNRTTGCRVDPADGAFFICVQPGLLLTKLRAVLAQRECDRTVWSPASVAAWSALQQAPPQCFPPDPTETSASIGGMVACNASGARSFAYGPTRRYVAALRVVLADGDVLALRRGQQRTVGRSFRCATESGRRIEGLLPDYTMPAVKNASGYFTAPDMDLLDLFVGSEGTLGVFSEIELRLIPAPGAAWGVTSFFSSEHQAVRYVRAVRAQTPRPVAVEFFDQHALQLLRQQKQANPAFGELPEMAERFHTAVYVEFHGACEDAVSRSVEAASAHMTAAGGNESDTWIATTEKELARLQDFRHAVPEAVNLLIDQRRRSVPGLTKLGTDMAVPDERLEEVVALYHAALDAAGLDYVMFGHIGNNHLHVNILPRSLEEYDKGKHLYQAWARQIVRWGGTISAEHGVGKLKVALLREMYGAHGIEQMQSVKQSFDPEGVLNRGNLF